MKMILAIMPTGLSEQVTQSLLDDSYRVTKFASTAGFLSGGTTTLMVITPEEKVGGALDIIRDQVPSLDKKEPQPARVTIYVLKVKDFEKV